MANTTFANLKISALRKAGNNYSANDATRLEMAGGIINDIMGLFQGLLKGHPFTLDIGNTVSTTSNQAYVDLTDTDIIEVYKVYQRVSNRALTQITYDQYITLAPDPTRFGGLPDMAWAPKVAIDVSGNCDWSLYLLPTPSSAITLYYDYIKNLRFTADGTSANSEFCKLPNVYDAWIYSEFKPLFYEIIDPSNTNLINRSRKDALEDRAIFMNLILSQATRPSQIASRREGMGYRFNQVETTPEP